MILIQLVIFFHSFVFSNQSRSIQLIVVLLVACHTRNNEFIVFSLGNLFISTSFYFIFIDSLMFELVVIGTSFSVCLNYSLPLLEFDFNSVLSNGCFFEFLYPWSSVYMILIILQKEVTSFFRNFEDDSIWLITFMIILK